MSSSSNRGIIGMPLWLLATLILLLLSLIIILPYLNKIKRATTNTAEVLACQQSIALFSTITTKTLGTLSPSINCPAPHHDISETDEKIHQEIAEHVSTCWEKTNGKENHITTADEPIRSKLGIGSGDSFCILCSTFTVTQPVDVLKLHDYMNTHYKLRSSQTYSQYLDTSWSTTDPILAIFLSLSKPNIIPLPNQAEEGRIPLKIIKPGTTYYITNFNHQKSNTVTVTSQQDASLLRCDRFLQQKQPHNSR